VDCVVVYKVDRLSRSLMDFARIVEAFDRNGVSFVSVTQQFNTTTSIGRLTLNILLSFAQLEREIISERTRDKMSAAHPVFLRGNRLRDVVFELGDILSIDDPNAYGRSSILPEQYGCEHRIAEQQNSQEDAPDEWARW
jgi:Resolvase, N terminal domain